MVQDLPGTQTAADLVADLAVVAAVESQIEIVVEILLAAAAGKTGIAAAGPTRPGFVPEERSAAQFGGFLSIVAAMAQLQKYLVAERSSEAPTEAAVEEGEPANSGPLFEEAVDVVAVAARGQSVADSTG